MDCFENKILLQIQDSFDYEFVLGAAHGMIPRKSFGRGIAYISSADDVCEFQTCLICEKSQISSYIKSMGNYLYQHYQYKVPDIKILPLKVTYNDMRKYLNSINCVPIGYTVDDVEVYGYNFLSKHLHIILGNNLLDNVTFFGGIIDLIDLISTVNFTIIDFSNSIDFEGNALFYQSEFGEAFDDITKDILDDRKVNIYFIIGIGNIVNILNSSETEKFNSIMNKVNDFSNSYFILVDDFLSFKNISSYEWYDKLDFSSGIWVGEDIDSQDVFDVDEVQDDIELNNIAYVIDHGETKILKVIGDNNHQNVQEKGLGDFLNG